MTKKLTRIGMIAIALAMALALGLTACGGEDPADPVYAETTAPYVETTEDPYDDPYEAECYCEELEDEDALCSVCEAALNDENDENDENDNDENDANDNDENDNDENDNDNENDENDALPAIPMPQGGAAILAEYTQVMDAIKTRQPTYTSLNYQVITNTNQLPDDVVEIFHNHFFVGGTSSIVPEWIADSRALVHRRDAQLDLRYHRRGPGGERLAGGDSNARWIGVSRHNRGSLATMSHVRSINIRDLGNDRRQIDITIADARNPAVIDANAATAPNSIAAFMEVQDIAEILDILDIGAARLALRAFGVNLTNRSYVHYSGSTIRAIYNARTMEAESIYKVGRMSLNFDGTINGINMSDHPVRIDAIFDFNNFDWRPAWPS